MEMKVFSFQNRNMFLKLWVLQSYYIIFPWISISVIILQEEGKVDVLANEAGDRITPAVVSITDEETVSLIF